MADGHSTASHAREQATNCSGHSARRSDETVRGWYGSAGATGQRRTRQSQRADPVRCAVMPATRLTSRALPRARPGRPAPRQCADGAVQLPRGARQRVAVSCCASRTPTPNAASTRCSTGSSRNCAGSGIAVGRRSGRRRAARAVPAERAQRLLRRGAGRTRRRKADVSLLLHARGAAAVATSAARRGPAAAVCAHVRRSSRPAEVQSAPRRRPGAGDPFSRARPSRGRIHRP